MEYHTLGRTGWKASAMGFGAWGIGGDVWGPTDDKTSLASGMLTGKFTRSTQFAPTDHRSFNRHGEAFDQGETFSGVDYETGLQAVEELRTLVPQGATMAQFALRWILMFPEVTSTIAGAKNSQQVKDNVQGVSLPPLSDEKMLRVREVYDKYVRAQVHHRW